MKIIKLILPVAFILAGCQDGDRSLGKNGATPQLSSTSQVTKLNQLEKQEIYKKLTDRMSSVTTDKFQGVEYWNSYPKDSITYGNSRFNLSIPMKKGAPEMHLVMSYSGDRWIFFDRIRILAEDEIIFDKKFSREEIARDHESGSVWELVNIKITDDIARMASKLGSAKQVTVRFSGEKIFDYEMESEEIDNFAKLAEIYDELQPALDKNKLNLPKKSKGNDTYWQWIHYYFDKKTADADFKKLKSAGLDVKIEYSGIVMAYIRGPVRNGRDKALEDLKIAESVGLNETVVIKAKAPN